jgi:medium-chain acyl-[acyl-carrier-protein] hydrolase
VTSAAPTARQARARSPWLPFGAGDEATVRLLCLPHAGAGASVYRAFGRGLPPSIGVCPVQPPGREKRRSEAPITSVGEFVRQLAPEVGATVRPPYALFGHSTGALCAFELAREIRRLGAPLPVHLFLAGRRAPRIPMPRTELAGSLQNLAAVLRRLGGTPEDVLASAEMLGLLQPLLLADFRVNEVYGYRAEPALPVPITTFASTEDPFASPDEVTGWQDETSARFSAFLLAGGHFAIFDHATTVREQVANDLARWS